MLNKQESLPTVKNVKLKLHKSNAITWYNKIYTAKQLAPKKGLLQVRDKQQALYRP
jgi:hypothetical protein